MWVIPPERGPDTDARANLVMPPLVFVVPGTLETASGGYVYDRQIIAGLRRLGWFVSPLQLHDSFPYPTRDAIDQAAAALAAIPNGTTVIVDGLALGAMPALAERESRRIRLVALVHHPLARETGIDAETAARLKASEYRALEHVARVIVTSCRTAELLVHDGQPPGRVVVVEPGTEPAPMAPESRGGPLRLLCVANLIPRKGHDVLFRALVRLSETPAWRLTCVGSLTRDGATVARLRAQLREADLDGRVTLAGELGPDSVADCYLDADVFVLPTLFEGYGMAVAEALARGLPVISTPTGAIPELVLGVASVAAGLLVPPGDVNALAAALASILTDRSLRERLASGARHVRALLPTWTDASKRMSDVLLDVESDG